MLGKKITAHEMAIDFISVILTIIMSIFCFFYFVLGNRMGLADDVARFFSVISIFGLFFIYEVKAEKSKIKKDICDGSLDDIIVYFSKTDEIKNLVVIFLQTAIILTFAAFNGVIDNIDKAQAFLFLVFAYLRHLYIFRKRNSCTQIMYVTNYDKIKDRVFVFFLPVMILGIAIYCKKIGIIDQLQALSVFLTQYFWHKYLIRKK